MFSTTRAFQTVPLKPFFRILSAPAAAAGHEISESTRRSYSFLGKLIGEERVERRKQKNEEKRKEIREEMAQSPFAELNAFAKTKGKWFEAPTTMKKVSEATVFPALEAVSLTNKNIALPAHFKGKANLVLLSYRDISKQMLAKYREAYVSSFLSNPFSQIFEIHAVERFGIKLLKPFISGGLRSSIQPSTLHDTSICYCGDVSKLRKSLKSINALTGYAFVVDSLGLIRWECHGLPTLTELKTMENILTDLSLLYAKK